MRATYPECVISCCPACGSKRFPKQADNSFLCGACSFHYYINPAAAVVGILEDDAGRVLAVRRGMDPMKGTLDLPGGFIDRLETAEDALVREVREELNLELGNLRYLCSFPNRYLFKGMTYFTLDLAFVCQVRDISTLRLSDEIAEAVSLTPPDFDPEQFGFESMRRIIKTYLDG